MRIGVTMEKVSVGAATLEINIEAKAATNLSDGGRGRGRRQCG